ncbi:MAG TPA: arylsulfotransferase family protein [Gemmataceae bacterium]|nr:arylsulfotransferase family protein [Gemmataceae bacterium]
MTRSLRFFAVPLKRVLHAPAPTFGQVMALFSLISVLGLVYLYGAAVMYFRLPSFDFLDKAFAGAKAWHERGRSTIPFLSPDAAAQIRQGVTVDQAEQTCDGFTLYTLTSGSRATLIDMRGNVVHRWELPFSRAWSHPSHVADPLDDEQIHWFRCYLYPNGDLLAVYHADGDTPYGYGLVKLNKDSKLLWAYAGRVHHDVDVGEDGMIYTLTQQIVSEPPAGLEFLPTPYIAESLVILSAEGQKLEHIPLLEAFASSPYALALAAVQRPTPSASPNEEKDPLHTNSVKVLRRAWAAKFPLFRAGQVLISLRNLDTVAVVDQHTHRVIWAAQGVWRTQHDAAFLDNGHLLIYDNCGSEIQTRILEYDPLTQAIPWAYANENAIRFRARLRGTSQRLSNGNTLIIDPDQRRLFEVTRSKALVWDYSCPLPLVSTNHPLRGHGVNSARRYRADELTFLKGDAHVRP